MVSDSFLNSNPDSSLSFISDILLSELGFSELMKIPDTTLQKTITLKNIKLGTRIITSKITLGQLAADAGAIGQVILNAHGGYLPVPPVSIVPSGGEEIDASYLFKKVKVLKGVLEMNVRNGLPVELRNVIFLLKNKKSGEILLQDTALSVLPGSSFIKTYPLDGKYFEGLLESQVLNVSTPGTGLSPVLIDTNDAIDINIKVTINQVSEATAIFPSQNLFDEKEDVEYHLDGIKLNFMKIKTGTFRVIVASTIPDSAFVTYRIPSAKYQGVVPHEVNVVLPPAPKGDTVYIDRSYPVDGYWFDLTGKDGNKFNTFYQHFLMRIDSTGKMMDLSLNDSIYLFYTLFNVIPEYVSGYLGNDSFSLSGTADNLAFFRKLLSGNLELDKLDLGFFIENGVGAKARLKINQIKATNTRESKTLLLNALDFSDSVEIASAQDAPFRPVRTEKKLTSSNAKQIAELLPDKIEYNISVQINPDSIVSFNDFIYNHSRVKAGIKAEMPLHFSAKGITLRDTVKFDIENLPDNSVIESGKLKVVVYNKFPLSARLQLVMLDNNMQVLDTVFKSPVLVAFPETPNVKNYQYKQSKLEVPIDKSFIEMIENAKYLVINAVFDTGPGDVKKKIYNDYDLQVKLIGDFILAPKF